MHFATARPDAVRAINQRWLLKFWTQHLDGARVPRWQTVKADDLASMADNLSLLDVTGDRPPRFLIRVVGRAVARVYDLVDFRGRYLDEVMPARFRDEMLAPYLRAAESGLPVYTIYDVNDGSGRLVHFERLLLPFARDGATVDRIVAAVELVCADGDFTAKALLSGTSAAPTLQLSATIETRAMV
jgi:hypothetical protein